MRRIILSVIVICIFISGICYSTPFQSKDNFFNLGINLGLGLPKIPISHYRTPVSICGSIVTYFDISHRISLNASGNGLYTFNLGSVLREKSKLKFDLIWANICLDYKLKFAMNLESFLSSGIGYYYLFQQFDDKQDDLNTFGFTIGIITNTLKTKTITQFEVRWHLLFRPEPKPQVLTVKFGILL